MSAIPLNDVEQTRRVRRLHMHGRLPLLAVLALYVFLRHETSSEARVRGFRVWFRACRDMHPHSDSRSPGLCTLTYGRSTHRLTADIELSRRTCSVPRRPVDPAWYDLVPRPIARLCAPNDSHWRRIFAAAERRLEIASIERVEHTGCSHYVVSSTH